ncbi:methylmalonyl Co-A mutase-associated GTPase MeaB [Flexistipes sinusarabici]|uniref:methylmalonyl Co-A mutase-associated GTPase MeaB n=1 Tax=Flexistipes sinusarabici TaxID=2352 RepID=UPI0023565E12|nr:methylmalonyl Co-A mutase-associated GTPase MeaB [Flexistipes sinusarabici]
MRVDDIIKGVLKGHKRHLAKAITLVESKSLSKREDADKLLNSILPYTGNSIRLGISGVPGVGKSTFIESFGKFLTSINKKVAVLAVDPSSKISGGSILGDKTRMQELAKDHDAFIRPSPSDESLGGVARKTRESMLICEAAGFDIIIVETVGVGQSEIEVASMVDCFTLLQLPGAGDELQGIKKGIMEISDIILINKSEGENIHKAKLAKSQIENALHILKGRDDNWIVKVLLVSALNNEGIERFWEVLLHFITHMKNGNFFRAKRKKQSVDWMWKLLDDELMRIFKSDGKIKEMLVSTEEEVRAGHINPASAAKTLLDAFLDKK